MIYALLYIVNIVALNWAFSYVPAFVLPGGIMWSPVALLVGFTFVIRDYAQREIGHKVLPAMLVGGIISWYMATPEIAVASMTAFMVGELADWAIYTFTGKPFSQRILLSSLVSTPLDSLVFLLLIDMFSPVMLITMTISKLVGAVAVFYIARRKELKTGQA